MRELYSLNQPIMCDQDGDPAEFFLITEHLEFGKVRSFQIKAVCKEVCDEWTPHAEANGLTVHIHKITDAVEVFKFLQENNSKEIDKFDQSFSAKERR